LDLTNIILGSFFYLRAGGTAEKTNPPNNPALSLGSGVIETKKAPGPAGAPGLSTTNQLELH
jgi:hypothetical protein